MNLRTLNDTFSIRNGRTSHEPTTSTPINTTARQLGTMVSIVNRLRNEYSVSPGSVPVLTARYLKKAVSPGYVMGEKRGRNVFYRVTESGNSFLINRRDQLDGVMKWYENPVSYGLMSFVVAPRGAHVIGETREEDGTIKGVENIDEFMKEMKEKNPTLRSMFLRFG